MVRQCSDISLRLRQRASVDDDVRQRFCRHSPICERQRYDWHYRNYHRRTDLGWQYRWHHPGNSNSGHDRKLQQCLLCPNAARNSSSADTYSVAAKYSFLLHLRYSGCAVWCITIHVHMKDFAKKSRSIIGDYVLGVGCCHRSAHAARYSLLGIVNLGGEMLRR